MAKTIKRSFFWKNIFLFSTQSKWQRRQRLQQRHGLQVLFDYGVHHHLEHHLDVGGVRGCGEVVVDEFTGGVVERDEGGGHEVGRGVHVAVCTWRKRQHLAPAAALRPETDACSASRPPGWEVLAFILTLVDTIGRAGGQVRQHVADQRSCAFGLVDLLRHGGSNPPPGTQLLNHKRY